MSRLPILWGLCALSLAGLPACRPGPAASTASPVQEGMFAHFALARDLRVHALNGDLEAFRDVAGDLARAEDTWGLAPGTRPYLEAMREVARRGAAARRPDEATQTAASVAAACGACHLAADATLGGRFQVAPPLLDDPATRHVSFLAWASRLLWDGLLGPSERLWHAGSAALADSDGVPPPRSGRVTEEEVATASGALVELARQASATDDPGGRAAVLGRIWEVCAGCHAGQGVGRGMDRAYPPPPDTSASKPNALTARAPMSAP